MILDIDGDHRALIEAELWWEWAYGGGEKNPEHTRGERQ
jgi:hypothetical protein